LKEWDLKEWDLRCLQRKLHFIGESSLCYDKLRFFDRGSAFVMGNHYCFVCGPDNPRGLHVQFTRKGQYGATARFFVEKEMAGWPTIQHGGITSTLLDEACAYVPTYMDKITVTAELNVIFKSPVRVGETLVIEAEPLRITRKLILVHATLHNEEGELKAEATAKMMVLSDDQRHQMGMGPEVMNLLSTEQPS
jgi:uncharacterized protein (TIGR00369 family)